jgi:hypothetical protein
MDKAEFIEELKKVLTDFYFDDEINMGKNIHGDKKVPQIEYRDANKTTCRTEGTRAIFIGTDMGTEKVPFHYSIIYSRGQKREYRRKHFYDAEIDKLYISGKTYEILLEKYKDQLKEING